MVNRISSDAHLVHDAQIFEKGLGSTEQRLVFRADDHISHVPLGAERIQQQLLPVGQPERRQHHKIVLVTDQKGRDGQRLWRLVCTCTEAGRTKYYLKKVSKPTVLSFTAVISGRIWHLFEHVCTYRTSLSLPFCGTAAR